MNAALAAALLAAALAGPPGRPRTPPEGDAASPGTVLTDAEARERALAYLGAIDTPIRSGQWRALGPAGAAALVEVARSRDALPTRRARALTGLSVIGGAPAERALLDLSGSKGEPFVVRSAAIRGAGQLLPEGRLLAALGAILEGTDGPRLRGIAAEVLARRAPATACPAVASAAERAGPDGRAHFERALRACGR